MPRHKGKIEAAVKFAQNNALKGRCFESLAAQNGFLAHWEKSVADTRIHGTTRQQVGRIFESVERAALQALPAALFPLFEEARRTVHRDGHIEFKRAYYSVPPEYVGRIVWVRHEARLLRIYNTRREPIALHALAEPGKFTTDAAHLHSRKRHAIERGAEHLLGRCRLIGAQTGAWAEAMQHHRGPQSLRVMLGLFEPGPEASGGGFGEGCRQRPASRRLASARSQAPAGAARQRRAVGLPPGPSPHPPAGSLPHRALTHPQHQRQLKQRTS